MQCASPTNKKLTTLPCKTANKSLEETKNRKKILPISCDWKRLDGYATLTLKSIESLQPMVFPSVQRGDIFYNSFSNANKKFLSYFPNENHFLSNFKPIRYVASVPVGVATAIVNLTSRFKIKLDPKISFEKFELFYLLSRKTDRDEYHKQIFNTIILNIMTRYNESYFKWNRSASSQQLMSELQNDELSPYDKYLKIYNYLKNPKNAGKKLFNIILSVMVNDVVLENSPLNRLKGSEHFQESKVSSPPVA